MRQSKSFLSLAVGTGLLLPAVAASGATMTINTTEPVGAVVSNPHTSFTTAAPGPLGQRDTFTTAFADPAYGARGQSFTMPDNPTGDAFDLSAITIRADANPDGTGGNQPAPNTAAAGTHTLRLWVFAWNPGTDANVGSQWILGDGSSDGDPFDGTGITSFLVNGDSFDISRSFSGEFLHFNTPGVQLAENTAYGYLVALESTVDSTELRFDQVRDGAVTTGEGYTGGAFIRSDAAAHTHNQSGDDMVFYVEATPIPEPAAAAGLLAMASLAIPLSRRRR